MEEVYRFGPYRVMGVIGEGGMGVVYRARHEETGSIVALKTVRLPTGSEVAGIRAEVRALASLRHPGIIRIVGEGVQDGSPWYAMELLEGRTLAAFRAELWRPEVEKATYHQRSGATVGGGERAAEIGGARTPPQFLRDGVGLPLAAAGRLTEVLGIVRQLCASLAHVHGSGLVHRDLKPSNVFLCADGRVVLMDFGLAAFHRGAGGRERLEVAGTVVGTVAFMPPEQLRREFVDARADLYALGCVLYELVTGRIPFDGQSWQEVAEQHLCAPVVPPSVLVDGLPTALDGLVVRLLGKQPQSRVGYAEDVVAALQPFLPRAEPDAVVPELRSRPYLYRPRLAGRREELAALVGALDGIASGASGGVILVGGESGAGKTFLVSELARQSTLRRIPVITGECLPLAGDATVVDAPEAPLHPLRPFLRAVADRCATFGRDETERILGFRGKVLAPYAPELLGLPGQDAHPEPEALPLEAARTRLLSALTEVLEAFASNRPLLLVLDDLQWADELTVALLASLASELATRLPLLIVGTYRSEDDTRGLRPLLYGARVQPLALARLDQGTMATLAADMLGTAGLPEELTDFLIRTTEGNPFFLAEYLRAAVAEGLLVRQEGVWRQPASEGGGRFETLALPRSLRALVDHRLASMSAGARRVAAVAALLGREAELPVLAGTLEQSAELLAESLGELVARQVLELPAGGGTYRFVHDKLREAALDTLLADERAAFHLRAAEAIEACTGDQDLYRLAHHYRLGRRSDKAFHYLYRAGRQALGAGGFGEAHEHLGAAVAIADAHPGSLAEVAAPLDRARLLRLYGETVLAKGTPGPAAEALLNAFHALEVGRLPATSAGWGWLTLRQLGRQLVHRVVPPSWLEAAPAQQPALEEAARIANALGYAYLVGARKEFLGAMLLAAHLADRSQAAGERALAYSALGSIVGTFGLWRMAGAFFRLARGGDLSHGARAGRTLMAVQEAMWLHYRRGDYAALEACVEPALVWCKAQGLVNDGHLLSVIRAHALLDTGALGAARARLEADASRAASLGDHLGAGWASEGLGPCYLALGRLGEAADSCARREAEVRAGGAEADLFLPAATAALALLRLGVRERAEVRAAEAFARLRDGPDLVSRPFALKALADLGEVMVVLAQTTGDATAARGFSDKATAVGRALSGYARRFAYLRPAALRIEARLAELRGKGAQAVALLEASLRAATERAMAPAEAMARLELGRQELPADARRAHLERAVAAFQAMDQTWHLVTAQAVLRGLDR